MQFLAYYLKLGVSDFNQMTWRQRKELMQYHQDALQEASRQQASDKKK